MSASALGDFSVCFILKVLKLLVAFQEASTALRNHHRRNHGVCAWNNGKDAGVCDAEATHTKYPKVLIHDTTGPTIDPLLERSLGFFVVKPPPSFIACLACCHSTRTSLMIARAKPSINESLQLNVCNVCCRARLDCLPSGSRGFILPHPIVHAWAHKNAAPVKVWVFVIAHLALALHEGFGQAHAEAKGLLHDADVVVSCVSKEGMDDSGWGRHVCVHQLYPTTREW